MHRVVPELIIEKYRAGLFRGKISAVGMFLDLTGFSSMTDALMQQGQHGAEVLTGLMHSVFDPLVETIFNYGGKIVSFAGDGIQALFPCDEGNEEAIALQALASAWTIQRKLTQNPERETIYGSFRFSARIGLAVGDVAWGILRSADGQKATYYFRGDAVDGSADAEHQAHASEIILTQSIYDLVSGAVEAKPFESYHALDGFIAPMPEPAPSAFSPVDVEIARLFMPEDVITQDIRGEFRQIVNLFARFPDLSNEQLDEFTEIIFELRAKYGGLVNRLDFGDKGCNMLVLWGAPVTHENDMGRALNFVMELKTRAEFPITAGVTYYIAHAGYLGSVMCEDYTCYGWGVNLASRFMMTAPEGSIWIDERVARRVKNRFELEHLGVHKFKGFAADQKVYVLKSRKQQEVLYPGDFVGREDELPRLIDFFAPLWRGDFAGLAAVVGEAGIGKSRLIYELKLSLTYGAKHCLWALCRSDQILRHSFNPFRYWLLRQFDISSDMADDLKKEKFNERLDQLIEQISNAGLIEELDRLRPVLGALLGLHWTDSFYEKLDAEGRYNNTLNALIALIKAESLVQPVILVVEDAHFLDEDSKDFLPRLKRALTASAAQYPVAILVSSRPLGRDEFLTGDLVDRSIPLGPLARRALHDLAEIYLGGAASPDLIELLETRAEGNPYFAEQILIYLKEENLLAISDQGWNTAHDWQETSLPTDIRALLLARLDQLPRHVRELVQSAAILGREFDSWILAEIFFDRDDIAEAIVEAERANIWSAINSTRYIFSHALLRDTAYSTQMRSRRMELHAIALTILERAYRDDMDRHYAELAYHAERALLSRKAFRYLREAGRVATNSYQNNQAVEYFTRALIFVPPDDLATQFDVLVERVELYSRMGKRDLQRKDLTALERWANELNDQDRVAKALMLRAAYYFMVGDYKNSIEFARQGTSYMVSFPNNELTLYTQIVWVMALYRLGNLDDASQLAQETLTRIQAVGNRKEEARILNVMGLMASEEKASAIAQKYLIQALEIARDIQDPGLENRVLNNLAVAEGSINRNYLLARKYYEDAYEIAHKIGDRIAENIALGNIGFAAGVLGDFAAACSYHEQSLLLSREIGNRYQETYTFIYLSTISGLQNEATLALEYAKQAVELAQQISEKSAEGWALLYLGHAYLLQSDFQQAITTYRKSIEIRNELNQPSLAMEPIAGLVETFLQASDINSASHEADKILKFLESGSSLDGTDEPLRVYYACYRLLEKTADPRAGLVLDTTKQILEKQLSNFKDEDSRKRFVEYFPWRHAIFMAER